MTPLKLALISIAIGIFPFLVSLLAILIANICGCELNAARAEKCIVFGRDISGVLYVMFMFHWLTLFTGGIGFMGVIAAGIWALVK